MAFTSLILVFVHPDAHQAFFFAPSNTVLRYPLLTLCALLTGLWAEAPANPARLLSIAVATAVSIFLETESGIITMTAAAMTIFFVYPWRSFIILPIAAFMAMTLVVFAGVLFVVFGSGAMLAGFVRHLFDPVFYYGMAGFGGWPMLWNMHEWNWLYHLVVPGTLLATLAVIVRACGNDVVDKRRAAVLGYFAVSGLMLLAKYTNQSLAGVWQMSAVAPFSVLGWWCVVLLRHIDPDLMRRRKYAGLGCGAPEGPVFRCFIPITFTLRGSLAAAMMMLVLVFLYSPSEARNPGVYGLRAWMAYPSLLKRSYSRPKGCVRMNCVANLPADSDVALIDTRTQPGEQVAIIADLYDWTYLVKAHRPPLMFFLPSADTFSEQQFEESMRRIRNQNYLFIPKGENGDPYYINSDDFRSAVGPLLGTVFQKDGEGDRLVAWKRVTPQGANGDR